MIQTIFNDHTTNLQNNQSGIKVFQIDNQIFNANKDDDSSKQFHSLEVFLSSQLKNQLFFGQHKII